MGANHVAGQVLSFLPKLDLEDESKVALVMNLHLSLLICLVQMKLLRSINRMATRFSVFIRQVYGFIHHPASWKYHGKSCSTTMLLQVLNRGHDTVKRILITSVDI